MRNRLVVAHEAEFVVPGILVRIDDAEQPLLHAQAVVRVDVFEPRFHVLLELVALITEQALIAVVSPHLVGREVPFQQCVVGRLGQQPESLDVFPQYFLDLPSAADVPRYQHPGRSPGELRPESKDLDVDGCAVLLSVAPYPQIVRIGTKIRKRGRQPLHLLRRAELGESDLQELLARIAITIHGGLVYVEATPFARLAHECRQRIVVEKGVILCIGQACFLGDCNFAGRPVFDLKRAVASEVEEPRAQPRDHCARHADDDQCCNVVRGQGQQPLREGSQQSPDRIQKQFDRLQKLHPTHPRIGNGSKP